MRQLSSEPGEESPPRSSPAYGFVGTGEITAAIVEGLNANIAEPPAVFLSPRGRRVGQELASRFPNVQVCDSNQDVLDSATSIVVAVRPPMARAVLEELSFRPRHVAMSAMAGVRLELLRDWAAPTDHIVRVIPLPSAAMVAPAGGQWPGSRLGGPRCERLPAPVSDSGTFGRLWVVSDDQQAM